MAWLPAAVARHHATIPEACAVIPGVLATVQGFVFLAIDTVPDYNDTAPLPPAGQSALWKYMAIYRQTIRLRVAWSPPRNFLDRFSAANAMR